MTNIFSTSKKYIKLDLEKISKCNYISYIILSIDFKV